MENDLDDVAFKDKCSILLSRLNEYGYHWPGTWVVLKRTFFIAQPLLIRQIVLYIKDQSELPFYAGYLFGVALFSFSILQAVISQQIFFRNSRIGMRIRNGLSAAIYKRLLTTNTAALHKTTAAQMINLIANDVSKFEELSHSLSIQDSDYTY